MPLMQPRKINGPVITAAIFAVALQIQVTLFKTPSYEGLRVSSADLLLPFFGLAISISLLLKKTAWPEWKKPFGWWALALITLVMTGAMVNGYFVQGSLNHWALLNKFTGWFVLLGYIGIGTWLATNYRNSILPVFIKFFCAFFILTACLEILNQLLMAWGYDPHIRLSWHLISGFMDNRNAFAFLFVTAACFVTCYGFRNTIIPQSMLYFFWVLFPLIVFFNGSRTLWICATMLTIFFIVMNYKKAVRVMLPGFLIGTLFFFGMFSDYQRGYFSTVPIVSMTKLYTYTQTPEKPGALTNVRSTGDYQRMQIAKGAVSLIKQYPLQGAGLGSAVYFQEQDTGKRINIIDNTSLWLLTETGIIGLLSFLACYAAMGKTLIHDIENFKNPANLLALCALLMMLCFAVFSLFHEMLYTRFLWFILGLSLAVPRTHPAPPAP